MNPRLPADRNHFSRLLLRWDREKNDREMPWKGEKDPYKIWLSEIILQQTRVDQGLAYYNRFVQTFPDVHKLAGASDEKVFKLWEGLGYYSRCRNLLHSARYISEELRGEFPGTYASIQSLKGVGPYTAAAIASFAFNLPHAVLDGNVFRVLARVFGVHTPTDNTEGKKYFTRLAESLLDKKEPGRYNQAIMDFGATVCKPQAPLCGNCIFRKSCYAFLKSKTGLLPVKEKKISMRQRWLYFFVITCRGKQAIRRREEKDVWRGLYEFPVLETNRSQRPELLLKKAAQEGWLKKGAYTLGNISPVFRQQLSHQQISARFILISTKVLPREKWNWVKPAGLADYPFPRIIHRYLASGA